MPYHKSKFVLFDIIYLSYFYYCINIIIIPCSNLYKTQYYKVL